MLRLRLAGLAIVSEQEAVSSSCTEDEGLTEAVLLAGVAAVCGGGGSIGDSLELGSDGRSVVVDVGGVVGVSAVLEVGSEVVVLVGAGGENGRAWKREGGRR